MGPGDPELITMKAKRIIEEVDVIVVPVKSKGERSTALEIIRPVVELEGKRILEAVFSMAKDDDVYRQCGAAAGDVIAAELDLGRDVAVITLGDVSIYSTYMYVNDYVSSMGYETAVIPGVTSFCSGAALAGIPLALGNEGLAVVPSARDTSMVEKALDVFDNVVVMKAGNSVSRLSGILRERGLDPGCATVISGAGMKDEYVGPLDTEREYGYFTTVIVKKNLG